MSCGGCSEGDALCAAGVPTLMPGWLLDGHAAGSQLKGFGGKAPAQGSLAAAACVKQSNNVALSVACVTACMHAECGAACCTDTHKGQQAARCLFW